MASPMEPLIKPLVQLEAVGCALPIINIDTDQIFPARFMQQPRAVGYNTFLFNDLRRNSDGSPAVDFPLNAPANAGAAILAAYRNFGSGSSREAAVYALVDAGIRCVLAPSFGDIFAANAVNNGLLPARMSEAGIEAVLALLAPGGVRVRIDLQACQATIGTQVFGFEVDPIWRVKLLNGWDDIDITRGYQPAIADWLARDAALRPWAALPAVAAPATANPGTLPPATVDQ